MFVRDSNTHVKHGFGMRPNSCPDEEVQSCLVYQVPTRSMNTVMALIQ